MVAQQRIIILLIAFASIWLTGCALVTATATDVQERLSARFVGQNVDAVVAQFGPPASTFKMNSGETSYVWQLSTGYKETGPAQKFYCKLKVIASPGGTVTNVTTEDASNVVGESICGEALGMRRS